MAQRQRRQTGHDRKPAPSETRPDSGRAHSTPDIPFTEWAAAIVGLVLVCGAIAFLLYKGVARDGVPPNISVEPESVVQVTGGYLVTIRAVNRGDFTAAAVTVEGALHGASGVAETSDMTFQFLPPNSQRKGGLFFEKNPRDFELKLRPKGYEVP